MAEFAYNNAKNASTGYTLFELNCGYHPWVFYEKDFNPRLQLKIVEELSFKLQSLIAACQQNLHHAQDLQKRAYNKEVKPQSYAPGKCNVVATWSYHVISFVIIQWHSIKFTFTYHLLLNIQNLIHLLWNTYQSRRPPYNCWTLELR